MRYEASDQEVKAAQFPHNVLIAGLFGFNLLMAPAVIVLNLGMGGLFIPLLSSGALVYYIYQRGRKDAPWFVAAHWRLAFRHARILLAGYGITAILILVAWLLSQTAHDPHMKNIVWTALTRIGILPTLVAVMITAIMEAGAISLATKREVPDKLVAKFPPP